MQSRQQALAQMSKEEIDAYKESIYRKILNKTALRAKVKNGVPGAIPDYTIPMHGIDLYTESCVAYACSFLLDEFVEQMQNINKALTECYQQHNCDIHALYEVFHIENKKVYDSWFKPNYDTAQDNIKVLSDLLKKEFDID